LAPALNRLNVRAAREDDLAAALALVEWEQPRNQWLDRIAEQLRGGIGKSNDYSMVCVAERDGEMVGFGVYGLTAGAIGTAAIDCVLVAPRSRRAGIGHRILSFAVDDLTSRRARVIFAELPGDPAMLRYRAMLLSHGFLEEARIDDYYRDGVPQIISRLDL
jgi:ribosomal protein S18 acetylase RimI-like enzyme